MKYLLQTTLTDIIFFIKNKIKRIFFIMTRVKRGNVARKRRKQVLKLAQGFRGSSSKLFRTAQQRTMKALSFSYQDRQKKKRQFSGLWVSRLNAAAHIHGMNYSNFRHQLKNNGILLNRKVLSQVAIRDHEAFNDLISILKK